MRKKVICIIGTRPEGIKMAPVVKGLRQRDDRFTMKVCATAQHREMLDEVMRLFDIVPDIDLNVMQEHQTSSVVAARVLDRLEPVLLEERPDWVLVQGDTTTVMAAAIAAYHLRIRVGHVEAGLRSYDKLNPFPEEMNRVIADALSDLHFAPTERARQNLLREGVSPRSIVITGNTVIDALLEVASRPWEPGFDSPLRHIPLDGRFILVTAHRRESFGQPIQDICVALRQIVDHYQGNVHIVYPVHPNPSIRKPVYRALDDVPGITLLPPVDYRAMIYLMKHCCLVLTDSGGLQEEAPSLGKPVLVLRQVTERPEAIEAGTARLVGTDPEAIFAETFRLLDDVDAYAAMASVANPYGDGHAAERIVSALLEAGGP